MKSGLDFDNDVFSLEMYTNKPSDQIKYILSKPLYATPGETFNYRDCDPELIANVLLKQTGMNEDEFVQKNVFKPLGITSYYWDKNPEGVSMGSHGLYIRARDMAKIGQLMLNKGNWNGLQILDPKWVEESISFQTQTPQSTDGNNWDYGYYWWIVNDYNAYTAWGHGGSFIFILPSQQFVAVMASMPDADDESVGTELDDFLRLIKPVLNSMNNGLK
jgi:CubicO group peptidase (beta-lactamase class C family)